MIVEPLLDDAAPDGVAVEMQGPPYTPLRPRRMSLMTHTLARAVKKGTAFPAFAKVPDFPICTFFFMDEAPNDVDLIETLKKLMSIDMLRCKLDFFGAAKFDPKSDRWTRITLYQGAPLAEDIQTGAAACDDWWLPVLALNP